MNTIVVIQGHCNSGKGSSNGVAPFEMPPEILDAINKMNEIYSWYEMQTADKGS